MTNRKHFVTIISALILLTLSCAASSMAQRKPTRTNEELKALKLEIESLKEGQAAIQKTLDEIKELLKSKSAAAQPQPVVPRDIVLDIAGAPVKGNANARVVLVDFSDYQCPFCARLVRETMPVIEAEYIKTGKIKYVFSDFPLDGHGYAFKAAAAANCAGAAGKYWEMHDRLFANQSALAPEDLLKYGEAIGLDKPVLQQCLESGKYDALIRKMKTQGENAGVRGTPTLMVGLVEPNSTSVKVVKIVVGTQPFAAFKEAIDGALAWAGK